VKLTDSAGLTNSYKFSINVEPKGGNEEIKKSHSDSLNHKESANGGI
jgi:hypothetical protein